MRHARVLALVAAIGAGATASAGGARPVSATELLTTARQMVLVTTPDWNSVAGSLRTFERPAPGQPWTAVRAEVPIVVGKNGTAWDPGLVPPVAGPVKTEGDGRSPAGVFALGTAFGFARAAEARWLKVPYAEVTPTLECVDDSASADYNRLVDRASTTPDWSTSEKMREIAPDYHWGVVVEYNTRPAVPRRGSCIFLHIGGVGGKGTAGCTAMGEPALKAVMQWLDPARAPVLVQLPSEAYGALRAAWGLPAPTATR
jgi:D-alanyl-D-alanine dipeptidase